MMTSDNSNTQKPSGYNSPEMDSYRDKQITPYSGQPNNWWLPEDSDEEFQEHCEKLLGDNHE